MTILSLDVLIFGYFNMGWYLLYGFQFSSVAQSCPTLCDPMDCSTYLEILICLQIFVFHNSFVYILMIIIFICILSSVVLS